MRYLLAYSNNFSLALALWPFASLALSLPILAILYHRDGRLRLGAALGASIAVFYLVGVACFTLYPLPDGPTGLGFTYGVKPQLVFWQFVADIRYGGRAAKFQLAANVALFVPLGFIAGRGFGWGPVRSALAGLAVSLLVETTQLTGIWHLYPYSYRTFDVDDLLTNTTGAVLGWAASALFSLAVPHRVDPERLEPTRNPGLVRRGVAFAVDVVLVWAASAVVDVLAQFVLRRCLGDWGHLARALELLPRATFWGAMLVGEWFVPLARRGSTPGGAFVRMTCETRERTGLLRLAFLTLRFAVIALVFVKPLWAVAGCAACWLVFRKMPYDLLPASRTSSRDA